MTNLIKLKLLNNMREIKFRYYDSTIKQFIYSDEFSYPGICERLEMFFGKARNYSEDVIQQFTGLKDKNGKEIYEGDIVTNRKRNWEIVWNEGGFFEIKEGEYLWEVCSKMQVIGNILENPKLA
jgi:uncharacterized phage protein (TIGR01671 family)